MSIASVQQDPSDMKRMPQKLRASERVLRYLLEEFDTSKSEEGTRLPSNKELAAHFCVSPRTVQTVIQQLVKQGRIRTRQGSGTYLLSRRVEISRTPRILFVTSFEELRTSNAWLERIGGGIFRASSRMHPAITLEGVSPRVWGTDAIAEHLLGKLEEVDGLIALPYSIAPKHWHIIDAYETAKKPVVFIHPPALTATANFVSPDYFSSGLALGEALRKGGRRRAVLLLQRTSRVTSISTQLRHAGFASGFVSTSEALTSLTLEESLDDTSEISGYKAFKSILQRGGELPDVVYSIHGLIATGALQALQEAGVRVPEDVSVVADTPIDLSETRCPLLTRVKHPFEELGDHLFQMLTRRIELKGEPLPGVYLPTAVVGGSTTTGAENELLGISSGME